MNEEMQLPVKTVVFGGMNIWTIKNRRSSVYRSFSYSFRYQHQQTFQSARFGHVLAQRSIGVGNYGTGVFHF
jgi:hypothetical protein